MERKPSEYDPLDEALREWKEARDLDESLPGAARSRILNETLRGTQASRSFPSLAPLFLPWRRVALAGVLPALLLTLSLGYLLTGREDPGPGGSFVRAKRVGDEVIFVIANGKQTHRVYKSNHAAVFPQAADSIVTEGTYRDRIDHRDDLVFYRID
jgi:hypothetical protein